MNKIIGVLWKKEKNGKEYYSGVLNDLRGSFNIAVFPNSFKKDDSNQPDMNIVISWNNSGDENDTEGGSEAKTKRSKKKKQEEDAQDEVPF